MDVILGQVVLLDFVARRRDGLQIFFFFSEYFHSGYYLPQERDSKRTSIVGAPLKKIFISSRIGATATRGLLPSRHIFRVMR